MTHNNRLLKNIITRLSIILYLLISQIGCKEQTIEDKINLYTDSLKHSPNNLLYYEERAKLYYFASQYENSLPDVKRAIELGSKNYEVYFIAGCIYSHDSTYDKAVKYLSRGIELGGDTDADHSQRFSQRFYRGMAYIKLRNYELAIKDLEKINDKGNYSGILSECYLFEKQLNKAIEELIKYSITQQIDSVGFVHMTYKDIASLYAINGDYRNAFEYINKAIQKSDMAKYLCFRGIIYCKLKNYELAISDLDKVVSLDAKNNLAEYYLSMLFAEKKDNPKAILHFNKAIQKGFFFLDLVNQNNIFKDMRKINNYKQLMSKYLRRNEIQSKINIMSQIFKQDKISSAEKHRFASDRIDAIFAQPGKLNEFIKLHQLLMESSGVFE